MGTCSLSSYAKKLALTSLTFIFLLALLAPLALAQTTAVTGTVIDPNGVLYKNATYNISFVPIQGDTNPGRYRLNGSAFTQTFSGTLNSSGVLSVTLSDSNVITPLGSTWQFQICSVSKTCFTYLAPVGLITGSSVDLSTQLSVASPVISGLLVTGNLGIDFTSPGSGSGFFLREKDYFGNTLFSVDWAGNVVCIISGCGSGSGLPPSPVVNGTYPCGYVVVANATVPATCPQSGLGGNTISGATPTYTFNFGNNLQVVNHDVAGSAAVTVTLPTPTTLENTAFGFSYENDSFLTDILTPTTWTMKGAATVNVPPGFVLRGKPDPFNATNWLAALTPGVVGTGVINGIAYSNLYPGATLDVRVNSCAIDAETGAHGATSHICSSVAEPPVQSYPAQITIGDSGNHKMTWLLPAYCQWTETVSDGTSYGLFQYGGTGVQGPAGNNNCQFIAGAAANGTYAMYGNNGNDYYRDWGWSLRNTTSTMASGATMIISGAFDNTVYENIVVNDYTASDTCAILATSSTGAAAFNNITIYDNNTGPTPLCLNGGSGGSPNGASWLNLSAGHPKAGQPNIKIANTTNANSVIAFPGILYVEGNASDTTTALVQITGYASVHIGTLFPKAESGSGSGTIPLTIGSGFPTSVVVDNFANTQNGHWTYPITLVSDSSNNCPVALRPCLTTSDSVIGNGGRFDNNTSTLTNAVVNGSLSVPGLGASLPLCTTAGKVLATSGCPITGTFYQTVQQAGTPLPQEPVINFPADMACSDNPGVSTDCTPSSTGGTAFSALTSSINTGAGTFGWSTAGAASTPTLALSGLPFAGTGTTSIPYMLLGGGSAATTWSVNGTYLGFDAASGFTGNFMDAHVNGGATVASLNYQGTLVLSGNANVQNVTATGIVAAGAANAIRWTSRTQMQSPSDGIVELSNSAVTGFTRIELGGTTSSFPAIKRNSTALNFRLADDSADADTTMGAITASGAVTLNGLTNAATGDYVCYNAGLIEFNTATCTLSLRKYKMDIAPLLGSLNEVMRLKPVEYRYKPDLKLGTRMQVGLIADDVAKVDPRIAAYKDNGELESVDYEHMTAVLVSAMQEQQKEIATLKKQVAALKRAKH